jgi:hypothetical protein
MGDGHPRARTAATVVAGVALGVVVVLAGVYGLGYTITSSAIHEVAVGSVWVNYTYTTATPANDTQPLNEVFQNFVPGQASAEGGAGSLLGFTMSPYDNSTVNCTLWSLTVFAPFALVSVKVTDLPGSSAIVSEPLPVTLPAAVHGTSHYANLWVTVVLPNEAGTFDLSMVGTASCVV